MTRSILSRLLWRINVREQIRFPTKFHIQILEQIGDGFVGMMIQIGIEREMNVIFIRIIENRDKYACGNFKSVHDTLLLIG